MSVQPATVNSDVYYASQKLKKSVFVTVTGLGITAIGLSATAPAALITGVALAALGAISSLYFMILRAYNQPIKKNKDLEVVLSKEESELNQGSLQSQIENLNLSVNVLSFSLAVLSVPHLILCSLIVQGYLKSA